jgi:dUTP pyrophosphatase
MVVAKLDQAAILPSKATPSAAGFDLHAPFDFSIPAWSIRTITTGIRATPPAGHYLMITGRSSLSQLGILTICGTVDPDFTGDIAVMLFNTQPHPFEGRRDQRIAQMIPMKASINCTTVVMNQSDLILQDHLARASGGRGARGFGSSGF